MKDWKTTTRIWSVFTSRWDRKVPRLSKHRHLVSENLISAYFCFLCSPTKNKPISIIVNPVFSKCGKGLDSTLKDQTEKPAFSIQCFYKGYKIGIQNFKNKPPVLISTVWQNVHACAESASAVYYNASNNSNPGQLFRPVRTYQHGTDLLLEAKSYIGEFRKLL